MIVYYKIFREAFLLIQLISIYVPEKTESSDMRGCQFVAARMKRRYNFPLALGADFPLAVQFPRVHCDGESEC